MATADQIARAARRETRPINTAIDPRADHYLLGATAPVEQPELDRAARLAWRQAPHVAEVLDLAPPPVPVTAAEIVGHDVVEVLLRTLRHDGENAARQWLATLDEHALRLAKQELARRREAA